MNQNKDTVLFLGGAIWSENLFAALKQLGVRIILTDINENSPMKKYSDIFINVSADDYDTISKAIESEKERIIISYCGGDFATLTSLKLNEYILGKSLTKEKPDIFNEKVIMKDFFERNNITTPTGTVYTRDELSQLNIEQEVIFKPIDLSGARGVEKICDNSEKLKYLNENEYDEVLVETLVTGTQHDVNGFFVDDKFYPAGLSDRFFSEKPLYPLCGYSPTILAKQDQEKIYKSLEDIGKAAGLVTGPLKGDVFLDNDKSVIYNEVGFRFHGDITSCIILPNTGLHFPFLEYLSKLNLTLADDIKRYMNTNFNKKYSVRWDVLKFPTGRFIEVRNLEEMKNGIGVIDIIIRKKKGDLLKGPFDNSDMLGYLLTKDNDTESVENKALQILNKIEVEIENQ